jgi:hypothetical protein
MKRMDITRLTETGVGQNNEWNEVHMLTRATFAQMAPSVLRLETGRLSELILKLGPDSDLHETLVSARHRISALEDLVTTDFEHADLGLCRQHLDAAILIIGIRPSSAEGVILDNIADRLGYVRERLCRLH